MSTQRTKAALDALLADNTVGDITPARIRDLLESLTPSSCAMHFAAAGPMTPIAAPSTFAKATNVTTVHDAHRFSMSANNRMRYDGAAQTLAVVVASLAFLCEDDAQSLAFAIAVNGVVDVRSIVRVACPTGALLQSVALVANVELAPGDHVEVWVANDTSDKDVAIDHGHVHVIAHPSPT